MNKNLSFHSTHIIILWFAILCFGPYLPFDFAPLRIDHIIFFPVAGFLYLFLSVKGKKIDIPKILIFLLFFLTVAIFSTIKASSSVEFFIKPVAFIAALDNHLRILFVFLLASSLSKVSKFDFNMIVKSLVLFGAVLSVFGFFQLYDDIEIVHKFVEKISINWFSGRSDRGVSIPKLLMRLRAVSTFYMPGNFLLFSSMMTVFIIFTKENLKFSKFSYNLLLFLNLLAVIASGSKGLFITVFVIVFFLMLGRKIKLLSRFLLFLILAVIFLNFTVPQVIRTQISYVKHKNFESLYNRVLGPRFGYLFHKNKQKKEKKELRKKSEIKKRKQEEVISLDKKQTANKKEILNAKVLLETTDVKTKKSRNKRDPLKGNLAGAMEVINKNKFFGVGYVSNVDYGDSMIIHLLVRGGYVGGTFFLLFVVTLLVGIYKKYRSNQKYSDIAFAWIISCFIFLICGIAFPSFIQDRSGDIFWWLGALLIFNKQEKISN